METIATSVPRVDTHLAKFSQASVAVLTALAFIDFANAQRLLEQVDSIVVRRK